MNVTDQEINEAVAKKLGVDKDYSIHGNFLTLTAVPDYCHDIKAAWEVVEYLPGYNFAMFKGTLGGWVVNIQGDLTSADTAPMAICRAFLQLP